MKKRHSLNLGGIICLIALVYITYQVLLLDDILPCSINSVFSSMNHWAKHWHILVVGLMPIYVALVFFGTAIFGISVGSAVQRWLTKFLH